MARSPLAAVGCAFVRAICAAAESRTGTPSTMIAAGKTIEHEASADTFSFGMGVKAAWLVARPDLCTIATIKNVGRPVR
jgi:hypothetical protein